MPDPGTRSPRRRDPQLDWLVVGGAVLALCVFFFRFTLDQPYHLDTTAYFKSLDDLKSGRVTCAYGTRCMVSYFMIPFSILGAYAIKTGFIVAAVLFFVAAYLFLARAFSRTTAYVASLVVLFIPAGIITITHLKEDFVGLTFLATALCLATRTRSAWRLLSPVAFSCSLLSKEVFVLFTPFYLAVYIYYVFGFDRGRTDRWRQGTSWAFLGAAVGVSIGLTLAIKRDYFTSLRALRAVQARTTGRPNGSSSRSWTTARRRSICSPMRSPTTAGAPYGAGSTRPSCSNRCTRGGSRTITPWTMAIPGGMAIGSHRANRLRRHVPPPGQQGHRWPDAGRVSVRAAVRWNGEGAA